MNVCKNRGRDKGQTGERCTMKRGDDFYKINFLVQKSYATISYSSVYFSFPVKQGSLTPGLWTSTGLCSVRNWAA